MKKGKIDENKKVTGKRVIIIIVSIVVVLVLGVISYIGYDRYYKADEEIPHDSYILEEDVTLSKEEVLEYLDEVPFYGVFGYGKDAYQGEKVITINDIDSSTLLSIASTYLDESQVLSYKDGMPLPDGESKSSMNEDSSDYIYIKQEDLVSIIKEVYNFDLTDMKQFNSPGNNYIESNDKKYTNAIFTYKDGYFISYGTISKPLGLRVSKLDNFNIKDGVLTITSKYGVYTCNEIECVLYNSTEPLKDRGLNDNNIIYRCSVSDTNCKYELNNNLKNNNMLKTYKHTFKLKDGDYYWESTVRTN